jgi:hypothetical protein
MNNMEALNVILANIAASAAGLTPVLYGLLVAVLLDTASGVWAAFKSGTFNSEFLPTFITSHLVKKVTPIFLILLAGVSVGGTDSAAGIALVATGAASVTAYVASVLGSIQANLSEGGSETKGVPTSVAIDSPLAGEVVESTNVETPDVDVPGVDRL